MQKTALCLAAILAGTAHAAPPTPLKLSDTWKRTPSSAYLADNGRVIFPFGETLHTVVCAPLRQCDIQLQAGEKVMNVKVGDKVRWKIEGARSGPEGKETVHIVVKPTQTGLATSLIITTDRRAYYLLLKSTRKQWMPAVAFTYPEESEAQIAAFLAEEQKRAQRKALRQMSVEGASLSVDDLDFAYEIDGEAPWKPTRVFSDGSHTYVDLPKSATTEDSPVLLVRNDDGVRVVNYRVHGRRYIVDGVFRHIELIAGVGDSQQKVTIKRAGQ